MPDVLQQVPQATLRIAGHDPWGYGQTLQAIIAETGAGDQVRLIGFESDVPAFLHTLDVFTWASRSERFRPAGPDRSHGGWETGGRQPDRTAH